MLLKLRPFLRILFYILIASVGTWLSCHDFTQPFPTKHEIPYLLTTAAEAEQLPLTALPDYLLTETTPFHAVAAHFVQFFGIVHGTAYSTRSYRLFSITLAVLFFCLIPALGLKRRGGLFETADAPFWVALFTFVSPAFIDFGCSFVPFSFQTFLFLSLLVAIRAYVQWPGYYSAIVIGLLIPVALIADFTSLWIILLLIPSICLGVGWRRLLLYWHTGHIVTMLSLTLILFFLGIFLGINAPIVLPCFDSYISILLNHWKIRLLWFGLGGFGVLAWIVVTIRIFFEPNRRWEKVIAFLFPTALIASFAFPSGSILTVSLVFLSAILVAFLLSEIRVLWLRTLIGCVTLLVLGFGTVQLSLHRRTNTLALSEQIATLHALTGRFPYSSQAQSTAAILSSDPVAEGILIWLTRYTNLTPVSTTSSADVAFIDSRHPNANVHQTDPNPYTFSLLPNHHFELHLSTKRP